MLVNLGCLNRTMKFLVCTGGPEFKSNESTNSGVLINSNPGFSELSLLKSEKKKSVKLIISYLPSLSTIEAKLALKLISQLLFF